MPRMPWLPRRALPRHLRRRATTSERLAWHLLRNRRMLGLKFRRQHSIGRFVVDFYCAELKLAIELDGAHHDTADQQARDRERTTVLETLAVRVLRIPNSQVSEANLRRLIQPLVPLSTYVERGPGGEAAKVADPPRSAEGPALGS